MKMGHDEDMFEGGLLQGREEGYAHAQEEFKQQLRKALDELSERNDSYIEKWGSSEGIALDDVEEIIGGLCK
jgi:hypothetical protein